MEDHDRLGLGCAPLGGVLIAGVARQEFINSGRAPDGSMPMALAFLRSFSMFFHLECTSRPIRTRPPDSNSESA